MRLSEIFRKPYLPLIFIIFIVYLLILIFISGFYSTIPLLIIYAQTVSWFKLSLSLLLSLIIAALVSITGVFTYAKHKERKQCTEGASFAAVGTVGGFIAGVCPLCVTGIFPIIIGLSGVSFTFASLPFQGIEIQILAIIILSVSLFLLGKK